MSHYLSDCCSLINLHCGFGGIQALHEVGTAWHIGDIALGEAQYARELDSAGKSVKVDLAPHILSAQYPLGVLTLDTSEERALYIELAKVMGDGEAQAFALAHFRNLPLLIDDFAAIKGFARTRLDVTTVSTPEVLVAWAGSDDQRLKRLPEIVERIDLLARFCPHKTSPHLPWWQTMLGSADRI